jgi:hypothetical protein
VIDATPDFSLGVFSAHARAAPGAFNEQRHPSAIDQPDIGH